MFKVEQIANYFIEKGLIEKNPVNPMKLQKLLYFAYGWYWAFNNSKLFNSDIQAWKYGPVVENIYHDVKQYGNYPITTPISKFLYGDGSGMFSFKLSTPRLDSEDNEEIIKFLNDIWKVYSPYNALELSTLTHQEGTPWDKTSKEESFAQKMGVKISDDVIKNYFLDENTKLKSLSHES